MKAQNAKSNSNINKIINGQEVRAAVVNKRKFYFVSDLVKIYGSSFISKLPAQPIVVRLTVNGNSQTRRLVNVMEFKTALKQGKKEKRAYNKNSKKVIAEQMELPLNKDKEPTPKFDQFLDEVRLEEAATDAAAKFKEHKDEPKACEAEVNDFHTARMNMLKHEIIHWCGVAAAKEEKARNMSKEDSKKSNNEVRRQVYYTVYQEFDRVLATKLGITQYQLSNHKLGKKFRLNGRYMDTVEKAGYLDLLHNVAKQMFNK